LTQGTPRGRAQAVRAIANLCYEQSPVRDFKQDPHVIAALAWLHKGRDCVATELLSDMFWSYCKSANMDYSECSAPVIAPDWVSVSAWTLVQH